MRTHNFIYSFMGDFLNVVGGVATGALNTVTGGLVGQLFQGQANRNQQQQQQALTNQQLQANESLSAFNYGQQYDLWQKTNYPAQVEQLQKAGLNPALLYGKGGGGGTTTGTPSGGIGMGIAPSANTSIAGMQATAQSAEVMADVKLKEAQAANLEANTKKTSTVDTANVQANIDNLKQLTQNATVQQGILEYESGIKSAEATVAQNTIQQNIDTIQKAYEQAIQTVRQATITADLSQATKNDVIKQMAQTTIQQQLTMALTKSNISVNNEQVKQISEQITDIVTNRQRWFDEYDLEKQKINNQTIQTQINQLDQQFNQTWGQIPQVLGHILNIWKLPTPTKQMNPIGFKY